MKQGFSFSLYRHLPPPPLKNTTKTKQKVYNPHEKITPISQSLSEQIHFG